MCDKLKLPNKEVYFMKKKILTILCSVFMLVLLAFTASANNLGDVTGDGKINAADARLALRYASKLEELTEEQITAADVDASGKVTPADARKILREAAGLTVDFISVQLNGKLIENGVLNVAVCATNPPFAYIEDGEFTGINIEMARKIASYYDLELKLHNMSEDELINSVKNNQCDIAFVKNDMQKGNLTTDDIVSYQYHQITLNVYFKNAKNSNLSLDTLKDNSSKKIGVVENSIADVMVTHAIANGELGNSTIKRYSRYINGKKALLRNEINAFIGDGAADYTGTSAYDTFSTDGFFIVSAAEKEELLDLLKSPVNKNVVQNIIESFCPDTSDSVISCEVAGLVIAECGTSIIEINIDSFYGYDSAVIVSSPYNTEIVSKKIEEEHFKYYLVITIPKNAKSGKVTIAMNLERDVTCDIPVEVVKDAVGVYNFGTFNSYMPDFGTVIGVAPTEVNVYTRDGNVAYIYSANDILKAGYTDNTFLEYFFSLMAQQGFTCTEENIGYMWYQLVFTNEYSGETVKYTESYNDADDCMERINVFLYHNF